MGDLPLRAQCGGSGFHSTAGYSGVLPLNAILREDDLPEIVLSKLSYLASSVFL
jgi:hypothetical protein